MFFLHSWGSPSLIICFKHDVIQMLSFPSNSLIKSIGSPSGPVDLLFFILSSCFSTSFSSIFFIGPWIGVTIASFFLKSSVSRRVLKQFFHLSFTLSSSYNIFPLPPFKKGILSTSYDLRCSVFARRWIIFGPFYSNSLQRFSYAALRAIAGLSLFFLLQLL